MTKKIQKDKTKTISRRLFFIVTGVQAVVTLVVASALFLFTQTRTQNWNKPSAEFVYLIGSAISGLSREASSTPDTGYQYIPEAKLRFKTLGNQKIVYFYLPADIDSNTNSAITISSDVIKKGSIDELYVHNQVNIPDDQQLFNRLPGVQNCNNIFVLSYDEDISAQYGSEYSLQKKINTGDKTINLWKHTGDLCNSGQDSNIVDELEQMLLSVEQY